MDCILQYCIIILSKVICEGGECDLNAELKVLLT